MQRKLVGICISAVAPKAKEVKTSKDAGFCFWLLVVPPVDGGVGGVVVPPVDGGVGGVVVVPPVDGGVGGGWLLVG
jgi:hypothetical protein